MPDGRVVETYDNRFSVGELRYLYDEVFVHDEYGHAIDLLPEAPVVVDLGANLGLFTLRVLRDRPRARVVAVEPVPGTAGLLRRNVAGAGDVHVIAAAAGAEPGEITMTAFRNVLANSTSRPQEKPDEWFARMRASQPENADELLATEEVTVPVVAFEAVWPAGAQRVDLLKVDVEGAELEVLRGVDESLWPRIDRLVIEVQNASTRLPEVLDLLAPHGYRFTISFPAMMPDDEDCRVVLATR
ncbi:hypothetical protein BJP25_16830 [Actinokineospora bangkokensis]|uniref:Methyltransferase FkbM domain-containing protein n=2 Tax=Actinokineospora bangkokensis TaxID=1193682 RepID=A0A1Q9LME3_9PSEU|nr:hypothetical protein BJP25_16830 [Actinokineospora bangkokensis]